VGGHVDRYVDDAYLADCEHAWSVVRGHAQAILDESPDQLPAADEHRAYCVEWLRRAAEVEPGPGPAEPTADGMAPTLDLLKHAAAEYPPFLRAETSGQAILLAGEGLRLWYGYFQSANRMYRPLNAAAAGLVVEALSEGRGSRLLEVGAGTGGATAHLLAAWPEDLAAEYLVTDASPRLLRATRQNLAAAAPANIGLDFQRYDLDLPAGRQRLSPESFDVVFAVNAIHNAGDLGATLHELTSLLRPGGALVLSESICGPGEVVHQELIMNLLPLPDDAHARLSRFHSREGWSRLFTAAGVGAEVEVNSSGPELVMTAVVRR
jgi:SAM-dependent methyltransferase